MRKLRVLFTSSFVRSVTVLVGGTAFAQGVALLALPLLTRLYSPTEFGILGVFVALLGMISVSAAGRYEVALPLPERDQDAVNLLAVALLCGLLTTAATAAAVSLFAAEISSLMRMPAVVSYLWMLPPAVALTCAYAVFQFWATRKMAFARVARTRAEQAIGGAGTQLLLGWIGSGAFGLIAGQIVNNGAGFTTELVSSDWRGAPSVRIGLCSATLPLRRCAPWRASMVVSRNTRRGSHRLTWRPCNCR